MSESTGIQALNLPQPHIWKTGSVGKPYNGIEIMIASPDGDGNGEVLYYTVQWKPLFGMPRE